MSAWSAGRRTLYEGRSGDLVRYYAFGVLPWFVPGVVVSLVIAFGLCRAFGRKLGAPPPVAFAIVAAFGVIVSATLTPVNDALSFGEVGTGTCDFSRIGLAPLSELLRINDTSLNVALFMPLGFAVALIDARRRRLALIVASLVLPFVIETIQLVAPILHRGCQSADVSDNLTGLVIGLVIGTAPRILATGA
jgi:hypothetical protein